MADDWEAAEDSEVEQEKAKQAAAAKAKADAEAAANKKTKSQRIEDRRQANMQKRLEDEDEDSEEEDDTERRARLRRTEQEADLRHAQDLFDGIGIKDRSGPKAIVSLDPNDPSKSVDLSTLPLFNPTTKDQFYNLRETLAPILIKNSSKAQYSLFLQEFVKSISKELPSEQIKKIASGLTTLSNEKLKEEKAADKGAKKTKAKSKTTLNATRDISSRADVTAYDEDGLDE